MRKLLLVLVLVIMALPSVFAGRRKEKSGVVNDYIFTDKEYGYSLQLNENWKYKIQKKEDNFRLILTQVKFAIPSDYQNAQDYTKIPKMVVFMAKSEMDPSDFIDSLQSESFSSDQKSEILKEFEIFNMSGGSGFTAEDLIAKKRKKMEINGLKANLWTGQVRYTNEVAVSASSAGGKRVKGAYEAMVIAVKKGDNLLLFHTIGERDYFDGIAEEAMLIINSLKWN